MTIRLQANDEGIAIAACRREDNENGRADPLQQQASFRYIDIFGEEGGERYDALPCDRLLDYDMLELEQTPEVVSPFELVYMTATRLPTADSAIDTFKPSPSPKAVGAKMTAIPRSVSRLTIEAYSQAA